VCGQLKDPPAILVDLGVGQRRNGEGLLEPHAADRVDWGADPGDRGGSATRDENSAADPEYPSPLSATTRRFAGHSLDRAGRDDVETSGTTPPQPWETTQVVAGFTRVQD
jgi:hypothetical protein